MLSSPGVPRGAVPYDCTLPYGWNLLSFLLLESNLPGTIAVHFGWVRSFTVCDNGLSAALRTMWCVTMGIYGTGCRMLVPPEVG